MDEVMGELKDIREEQAVQSHQLSDHSDRIEKNRVPHRHIFDLVRDFLQINIYSPLSNSRV